MHRNLFPKDDRPNTSSLTLNIPLTIFLHSYLLSASTFHLPLIWEGNLNANEYRLYLQLLTVFVYLNYRKSDGLTPCIVFGYQLLKLHKDILYSTLNEHVIDEYYGCLF